MGMAFLNIDVTRNHSMTVAEAKQKAEHVVSKIKTMDWCKDLGHRWEGDAIHFQINGGAGAGVKGWLRVAPTTLAVHIELTYAQLAGKPFITSKIDQYLSEAGIS